MNNKITICQGISGSGKSTWSNAQAGALVFSTDDYFMVDGVYRFEGAKLGEAHAYNLGRAEGAMMAGAAHVIIDNTNTQRWHYAKYILAAEILGYAVEFKVFECDIETAFARNTHSVPKEAIERMANQLKDCLSKS